MKKVDKSILITGMIVLGVMIVVFGVLGFFKNVSGYNTISASGESSISVSPDLVVVYFEILTTGSDGETASEENSEIYDRLYNSLTVLGFTDEQIVTQGYSVYPNYDYSSSTRRITGYTASHSVNVEIDASETDKIGPVLDAGIDSGAGISYISYELTEENQSKYKAEAIRTATEDARVKAEALAEGAGERLGKLVSISSSDYYYYPMMAYSRGDIMEESSGSDIATDINPSEQDVSARVTVLFRIR